MNKIAFIDRDGTLIKEPEDFQIDQYDKFQLLPNVVSSLKRLKNNGYQLVMVTNQDGLGSESYPKNDFEKIQTLLLSILKSEEVEFDNILICPHFEPENCNCRKPKLGLVEKYLNHFDPERSFVVGDRESDTALARNLGINSFRVDQTGWNQICETVLDRPKDAICRRKTSETEISTSVKLDGKGLYNIDTGIRFLDHMLEQISKHSGISISVSANGDTDICDHHTVEDVALTLGDALNRCLGDRRGIARYGFLLPMDESLCQVSIDLSGRPYSIFEGSFSREAVGDLSTEMVPHFFKSLSDSMRATFNIKFEGQNAHHQVESIFKSFGRCLRQAVQFENNMIPSTKGAL